jgi:hypothetical protein
MYSSHPTWDKDPLIVTYIATLQDPSDSFNEFTVNWETLGKPGSPVNTEPSRENHSGFYTSSYIFLFRNRLTHCRHGE